MLTAITTSQLFGFNVIPFLQAECLCVPGVIQGRNLVFCAPTSAGKTIVYEILALRRLLTTGKPFMLVLPTVVLCAQKASQ